MASEPKGISIHELGPREAVYTFVDAATGSPTHIAASTLLAAVQRAGIVPYMVCMGQSLCEAIERGDLNRTRGLKPRGRARFKAPR